MPCFIWQVQSSLVSMILSLQWQIYSKTTMDQIQLSYHSLQLPSQHYLYRQETNKDNSYLLFTLLGGLSGADHLSACGSRISWTLRSRHFRNKGLCGFNRVKFIHDQTRIIFQVLRNSTAALKNLAQFADSRSQMLISDDARSSMSAVAALIRLCTSSGELSLGSDLLGDVGGVADPTGGRDPATVAQVMHFSRYCDLINISFRPH